METTIERDRLSQRAAWTVIAAFSLAGWVLVAVILL